MNMFNELTPEQQSEYDNALRIGAVLASTIGTGHAPPIRVNPLTCKEAVGFYTTLGAKKPFFQSGEQFVMNCLVYDEYTFAACAQRTVLFFDVSVGSFECWTGGGKAIGRATLNQMKFVSGGFEFMMASMYLDRLVFDRFEAVPGIRARG